MSSNGAPDSAQPGRYSKKLSELSKLECQVITKLHAGNFDDTATREQLLRVLLMKKPELKSDAAEKLICFEIYKKEEKMRIKAHAIDDPDTNEFPTRVGRGAKIKIADVLASLTLAEATKDEDLDIKSIKSENEETQAELLASQTPATPALPRPTETFYTPGATQNDDFSQADLNYTMVEAVTKITERIERMPLEKQKSNINSKSLHYDNDQPIHNFIRMIQTNAKGQGLKTDEERIRLAVQVLSQSASGVQLLGMTSEDDLTDWSKFTSRLMSMQGLSARGYELQFLGYKRKPEQSAVMMMSELIQLYKLSQSYPDGYELNNFESKNIIMRFTQILEPELRNLLQDRLSTAKENGTDTSNLDFVARQCQQLELCFELGANAKKTVNAVKTQESTSELAEIMNVVKEQLKEIKKLKSQRSNEKNFKRLEYKTLDGFCFYYAKNNQCRRGENCKYKHKNIPKKIFDRMREHGIQIKPAPNQEK